VTVKSINEMVAARQSTAIVKVAEGEVRPPPFNLPISGGTLWSDSMNWWQLGYDIVGGERTAIIEACISAYAQTTAMLPGDHWWLNKENDGLERVETSSLSRILRSGPNDYQTMSDFLLNAVDQLYSDGNFYALAVRNSRNEIEQLHLMESRQCSARIAPSTGDVFYNLGGNVVVDYRLGPDAYPLLVPKRDVLHVKLRTSPYNMLLGESPILSAARDLAANNAMLQQQIAFYTNQARPSTVLTSDQVFTAEQVNQLRDRWNAQSRQLGAGGVVILGAGLKPVPMSVNPVDAQLAEVMKMSKENIALAFRVPMQVLGFGTQTFSSTEELMQFWLATSLNFVLNHIETAFDQLFDLAGYPNEYLELDTSVLLRSAMKNRVEAFARGVTSGIFSPNEARADFGKKKMPEGDEPRLQAQMVPLSVAGQIPTAPTAPAAPAALPAPKEFMHDEPQRVRSRFRASHSRTLAL